MITGTIPASGSTEPKWRRRESNPRAIPGSKRRAETRKHGDCGCERCVYCGRALTGRHEHDHFPISARHGGKEWVPSCLTCHDLKDRIPMLEWPSSAAADFIYEWINEAPPMTKLVMAKLVNQLLDYQTTEDEAAA